MTSTPPRRPTPPGTWPLLISGVMFLLLAPVALLGQVVPQWLSLVGFLLFIVVAFAALAWSFIVFVRVEKSSARGVPIAGIAIGVVVVVVSALMVPLQF